MSYNSKLDLIQNMREMRKIADEINQIFHKCSDNIDEIFNLRDQFADLENRTIKIVDDFEQKITEQSDSADELIAGYQTELERLTDRVNELLGLTEDFESIGSKVAELLKLSDTVTAMEEKVNALADKSGIVVIPEGETIELVDRKPGTIYFQVTKERTTLTDITTIVVSPNMGLKVVDTTS